MKLSKYNIFRIGWIAVMCTAIWFARWDAVALFNNFSYWSAFILACVVAVGYSTVSAIFTEYVPILKRWALPLSAVTFGLFYLLYHFVLPDYPKVLNLGLLFSSIFIGMLIWADHDGKMQENLYNDEDQERLEDFMNHGLVIEPLNGEALPERGVNPLNHKLTLDLLKDCYRNCSKEVLQYAVGEIIFPGAYAFATSRDGEAVLFIKVQKGEPQTPHILCDGSANGIMVYDDKRTIALCSIAEGFRHKLARYSHLYVCEVAFEGEENRLAKSYYVPITVTNAEVVARIEGERNYRRAVKYDELPISTDLPQEQLLAIKEQLIEKAHRCEIEVSEAKATIGKGHLLYELFIPKETTEQMAMRFAKRLNSFYQLDLSELEEGMIAVEVPYRNNIQL